MLSSDEDKRHLLGAIAFFELKKHIRPKVFVAEICLVVLVFLAVLLGSYLSARFQAPLEIDKEPGNNAEPPDSPVVVTRGPTQIPNNLLPDSTVEEPTVQSTPTELTATEPPIPVWNFPILVGPVTVNYVAFNDIPVISGQAFITSSETAQVDVQFSYDSSDVRFTNVPSECDGCGLLIYYGFLDDVHCAVFGSLPMSYIIYGSSEQDVVLPTVPGTYLFYMQADWGDKCIQDLDLSQGVQIAAVHILARISTTTEEPHEDSPTLSSLFNPVLLSKSDAHRNTLQSPKYSSTRQFPPELESILGLHMTSVEEEGNEVLSAPDPCSMQESNELARLSPDASEDCDPESLPHKDRRCYVKLNAGCYKLMRNSYINYLLVYYDTFSDNGQPLFIAFMVILLLMLSLFLTVVTEDFFTPIMIGISKKSQISYRLASATFLTFATTADLVVSSFVALTTGKPLLGVALIFGAMMFLAIFSLGLVSIAAGRGFVVSPMEWLRGSLGIFSITLIAYFLIREHIKHVFTALILICCYFIFMLVVYYGPALRRRVASSSFSPSSRSGAGAGPTSSAFLSFGDSMNVSHLDNRDKSLNSVELSLSREGSLDEHKHSLKTHYSSSQSYNSKSRLLRKDTSGRHKDSLMFANDEELTSSSNVWNAVSSIIRSEISAPSTFFRAVSAFGVPFWYICRLTIALPFENLWDWRIAIIAPLTTSLVTALGFHFLLTTVHNIPIFPFVGFVGIIGCAFVYRMICKQRSKPVWVNAFLLIGVLTSLGWLFFILNELINIITTLCIIYQLAPDFVGVTVLAWMHCIRDVAANVMISKLGFPLLAMPSCLTSPVFNGSVGLGLGLLLKTCFGDFTEMSTNLYLVFVGLIVAIVIHVMVAVASKWKIHKFYGVICVQLYCVFIGLSVLQLGGTLSLH